MFMWFIWHTFFISYSSVLFLSISCTDFYPSCFTLVWCNKYACCTEPNHQSQRRQPWSPWHLCQVWPVISSDPCARGTQAILAVCCAHVWDYWGRLLRIWWVDSLTVVKCGIFTLWVFVLFLMVVSFFFCLFVVVVCSFVVAQDPARNILLDWLRKG